AVDQVDLLGPRRPGHQRREAHRRGHQAERQDIDFPFHVAPKFASRRPSIPPRSVPPIQPKKPSPGKRGLWLGQPRDNLSRGAYRRFRAARPAETAPSNLARPLSLHDCPNGADAKLAPWGINPPRGSDLPKRRGAGG